MDKRKCNKYISYLLGSTGRSLLSLWCAKVHLKEKCFGVFPHYTNVFKAKDRENLLRGFDDIFYVPHSRHTEVRSEDVRKIDCLEILSESDESGLYIVASKDGRQIFVMGHSEYDPLTLKQEYERDLLKGDNIQVPKHYFIDDNPDNEVLVRSGVLMLIFYI